MLTAIVFILIFGLLVFVHELGHFFVARKNGVKVNEFGFGFPPRLVSFQKIGKRIKWLFGPKAKPEDESTVFSLNLIPLGGFVDIFGEKGEGKENRESFASRSVWTRSRIVVAGVLMNFLLAYFLLSFAHFIGLPTVIDEAAAVSTARGVKIQIIEVRPDSPAFSAGLKVGDEIVELRDDAVLEKISEIGPVQEFINSRKGKEIVMVIKRGAEVSEKKMIPRPETPEGEGPLGVALAKIGIVSQPWYLAPLKGAETFFGLMKMTLSAFGRALKQLFADGSVIAELSGPVGIAVLINQATKLGFIYILQFTALLSLNLAIINLLPFPALDGGRLLFFGIEKIKGSPVSEKFENIAHTAGFVILIVLMILITIRDVGRWL